MLKNGFYNVLAGIVRMGISIATIPLIIRSLGVEEYGLFALASTVIGIINLAEAGLTATTTVFLSQYLAKDDFEGISQTLTVVGGGMFIMATLGAVGMFMGAEPFVNSFPKLELSQYTIVTRSIQVGSIVVWARLLQQIFIGIEQAYQCYFSMNLLNTAQSIVMGLGLLVVVWSGGRTLELMQWQAGVGTIALLAHVRLVYSLVPFHKLHFVWNKEQSSAICKYSLQSWFTSLGGVLFTQVDKLIVGSILGAKELGIYAAITSIAYQINVLSALPVQPIMPIVSNYFYSQNLEDKSLYKQIKAAFQLNALVSLGLGMILFTLAPLLLSILDSKGLTADLLPHFRTAVTIYALYSLNSLGYFILFSIHQLLISMKIVLLSGVLTLVLIYMGANMFGTIGAIVGNIGYLAVSLLTILAMHNLNIELSTWLKWLTFPISIFFVSIMLSSSGITFPAYIAALVAEMALLLYWYLKNNPLKLSSIAA